MVIGINSPTKEPERRCHAEYKAAKKMDQGGIMYVARVLQSDGTFAMSRPCRNCLKVLKSKRIKKVYYTISNNEFGVINLEKWDERTVNQGSCNH
jgi:deoxycytidylate deaminase